MDTSKAITTTTTTEIDWWALGRTLASQGDSDEQAVFLHGFAVGLNGLPGGQGAMQAHYIRASIGDMGKQFADETRGLLADLAPDE